MALLQQGGVDLSRVQVMQATGYVGVTPATAGKDIALQDLCRTLHISLQQVVAFCDEVNDIDMLAKCVLSIAPANAVPSAQKAAKRVSV
eukprot:g50217.t1